MKRTHEQFLEDLWNKNKHYREGKFKVVGQYECRSCKIGVMNHLNVLLMPRVGELLSGSSVSIKAAVDKSQYFKNLCHFKFGDDDVNDLSEVVYINNNTKIKVIDKDYGEYFITPSLYLKGHRSAKRRDKAVSINLRADKASLEKRIKEIHPELEFTLDEYTNMYMHVDIRNKYGVCRIPIGNLLRGCKPTIKSAINKTEYFINQAREIHGDKYDYSLAEWMGAKTKMKIIGSYGVFEQNPYSHLKGVSCSNEAIDRRGWTSHKWKMSAEHSNGFTGYKVYFLECWDEKEMFYKIGRTYRDIKKRFKNELLMPYSYNIVYIIELDDPKRICELEQEYKRKHKDFKYTPTKKFGGMHECFSQLIFF